MTDKNATSLAWYYANKDRILAYKKEYYQKTKEKRLATNAEYRKNNPEKLAEINKVWRLKNSASLNARNRARKAAKLNRTPEWLTVIDFERIENEYKLAALLTKVTGSPWQVDHILPLQGKTVSGLHVPSNLRAIPAFDNKSKHNKYEAIK
jgi:hypothetical protein